MSDIFSFVSRRTRAIETCARRASTDDSTGGALVRAGAKAASIAHRTGAAPQRSDGRAGDVIAPPVDLPTPTAVASTASPTGTAFEPPSILASPAGLAARRTTGLAGPAVFHRPGASARFADRMPCVGGRIARK